MRTVVGVLLAAVLVVGGCSGESSPGPDDGPPSDPTVTESSQPTDEPTRPVVAEPSVPSSRSEFSADAATEFLAYFFDLYSYINATKDFDTWDEVSDQDCLFCTGMRRDIEDFDGYLYGVHLEVISYEIERFEEEDAFAIITMTLTESASVVLDESGNELRQVPAHPDEFEFTGYLDYVDGAWQIREVV